MKAVEYSLGGVKTAAEALSVSHLDWVAEPIGLITESGHAVPTHRAIVRSDNNGVIGVVGKRYVPLQNPFAFSFFDTLCDKHGARYDRAYVIDGGHKVILEATLNGPITIRKGDEVLRKISIINTFDGSYPLTAQFTIYRQVCKNGLMGYAKDNKCRVYHTKNGEANATSALMILAAGTSFFEKFEAQCRILSQKIVDKEMVEKFLKNCFGEETGTRQKNLREKVVECYEAGKGTGKGTLYDLYNGYIEWIDHFRSADEETRLANAVLGAAYLKEHAFDVVVNML